MIQPGFDLWVTPPGNAEHDFATSPIPADFFYPGSDPFVALVPLQGIGAGCGGADTVIERLDPALFGPIPSQSNFVDIEIVELQLQSVQPIQVTGSQPPEFWALDVTLPPGPQPQGQMQITKTSGGGGVYDADLPVCPLFVFNRLSGPPAQVQLDLCGAAFPPVQVQALGSPWTNRIQQPLICGPPNIPSSALDFLPLGPHTGPHAPLPLEVPIQGLPALGSWAIALLLFLLTGVGVIMMLRRVGASAAS